VNKKNKNKQTKTAKKTKAKMPYNKEQQQHIAKLSKVRKG